MVELDEDALICDLAETYHLLNYRGYPLSLVGTLACGLRDNSRIKMKMSGQKLSTTEILLATCADQLSIQTWTKTKDAQHGRNKPKSLLSILMGETKEHDVVAFNTPEEFEKARRKLLESK